jgi:hypothetical protein
MQAASILFIAIGALATFASWNMQVTLPVGSERIANFHGMHQQLLLLVWSQFQIGFGILLYGFNALLEHWQSMPKPPVATPKPLR